MAIRYRCPDCGSTDLWVIVMAAARLVQTDDNIETEIEGDHEWDGWHSMGCNDCDNQGSVRDYYCPAEET